VFIDATLVRIVIGPALLRVAGDWNWWPGGLAARRASVKGLQEIDETPL
jgi:RND superfamily putative drug exporter